MIHICQYAQGQSPRINGHGKEMKVDVTLGVGSLRIARQRSALNARHSV